MRLVLAAREFGRLLDADGDGVLTDAELAAARGAVEERLVGKVAVSVDGQPCASATPRAAVDARDGVAIDVTYACPLEPGELSVRMGWLADVTPGHKHVATLSGGTKLLQALLDAQHPDTRLSVVRRPAPPPAASVPPWARWIAVLGVGLAAGIALASRRRAHARDPKGPDRR